EAAAVARHPGAVDEMAELLNHAILRSPELLARCAAPLSRQTLEHCRFELNRQCSGFVNVCRAIGRKTGFHCSSSCSSTPPRPGKSGQHLAVFTEDTFPRSGQAAESTHRYSPTMPFAS